MKVLVGSPFAKGLRFKESTVRQEILTFNIVKERKLHNIELLRIAFLYHNENGTEHIF
jgi:hypothetical protein